MNTKLISESIDLYLHNHYGSTYELEPLQEEASTRRYFLIQSGQQKDVLCLDQSINTDFLELSDYLTNKNIRVPKVINVDHSLGIIIMSWEGRNDLSTLSLEDYKIKLPEVLDLLLKIQSIEPPDIVKNRKFDVKKLSFEVQLTISIYTAFQSKFSLSTNITNEMILFLNETIGYLDKHPINVFTHRDFHSRNILINDFGGLTLIDFQDARMGVPQYDLASIIYDAYYPLPTAFRKDMIDYFQKKTIGGNTKFKETFYLQALQRSFKALGTYFRMVVEENREKFKPSILSCLEQLEEIVQIGLFADSIYIFIRSLRNELSTHPEFKK